LILLIVGVGQGLSLVSPWASEGVSATSFGVTTTSEWPSMRSPMLLFLGIPIPIISLIALLL
jgi:hypothetical protein